MAFPEGKKQQRNTGLIIAFLVCFVIAIILLIILLTLTFKVPGCDTRECVTSAAAIIGTMNINAEPCEDFYEYACGNFEEQVPWTERYFWTISTHIKTTVHEQLFKEMQNDGGENNSTKKAKDFYRACMDLDAINNQGSHPLLILIKYLGSWELSRGASGSLRSGSWDFEKSLAKAHSLRRPIFFDIMGGSNDLESYRIVPRPEVPIDLIRLFPDEAEESTVTFIKNIAKQLNPGSTVRDLDKIAHDVYYLNLNVSQRAASCASGYPKTFKSLEEFDEYLGDWFDFEKYWKEMTGQPALPAVGNVTVRCPEYFKQLESLLDTSTTTTETLANTLVWNAINRFTATMGNEYRSAYKRSIRWERWEYCLERTLDFFPGPLLSIYASSAYDEAKRNEVDEMVTAIIDAYTEVLENDVSWVHVQKELQKLKALQRHIAQDSVALDLEAMDNEYDDYEVSADNFDNHKKLESKVFERRLEPMAVRNARPAYTQSYTGSRHLEDPSRLYLMNDVLDIPSGALQRPYYSSDFPGAVNFGALGMEISSEFVPFSSSKQARGGSSPAADDIVVETNATGDGNATTPSMTIFGRFARHVAGRQKREANGEERTVHSLINDLRQQHNDLQLSGFDISERQAFHVLKDLGGVQLAFKAYHKWLDTHSDTGQMVGLDHELDEVFFLGYAQSHCIHVTRELKEKIAHFGYRYMDRSKVVNQVLMNTAEFAEAFGCSRYDGTMHPTFEKINVWE